MILAGFSLIGASASTDDGRPFHGVSAATGSALEPAFHGASRHDTERACALAEVAFAAYRSATRESRAVFLEQIAVNIEGLGDPLIERCMAESGLPRTRLEGERGRTVGQLRLFAAVVREGGFLRQRSDPALPDRLPVPRPELAMSQVPLGPVAVFGASNFPLAFSVAGGDTASALAAGCPVVVKAHPAHPGTSELVGRAICAAVQSCGMPEGVFSLLFDDGHDVGTWLVADSRIKAVGFTGSRGGGLALMAIAQARAEPIPVYAEMSSINPVVLLPGALASRGADIARAFVDSMTLGSGQFCTKPGIVLAVGGADFETFVDAAVSALGAKPAQVMLTAGIAAACKRGSDALNDNPAVQKIAAGEPAPGLQSASLFRTTSAAFIADHRLGEEVFGASSLIVCCETQDEVRAVLHTLEGQLTIALHFDQTDLDLLQQLVPICEMKAGRIIGNGFGTNVEVASAMVHGGPFPATSDSRTTSVGTMAIERFTRPVCYQNLSAIAA